MTSLLDRVLAAATPLHDFTELSSIELTEDELLADLSYGRASTAAVPDRFATAAARPIRDRRRPN